MSLGFEGNHGGGQTTFVTKIQPNDVLMGRGAPISDNRGNKRFLSLIREKCADYHQAGTRKEKDAIARQIVSTIHARNGLFLRKIDSHEEATELGVPPDVAAWTTADEKTVLLKIKQALRDRGLEVRGQARTSPQDHAQHASAVPSDFEDEELGDDEMVAHGISSHESLQPPTSKRAKTQPFQGLALQTQATPQTILSAPTQAPAGTMNQFQGMAESRVPTVPLFSNFSQSFNRGPLMSQTSLTPNLRQLPREQTWNANAAAGLNLPPASVPPNLQLDGGKLQADFRPAFAIQSLQVKGGEMKTEKEPSSSRDSLNNNETSGEVALQVACDLCEKGQTPSGGVKLDPIELCLLSVLTSRGLPTWSSTQFRNGGIFFSASNNTPCPLTWTMIGHQLVQEVQSFLFRKTSKLFPNDTPSQRGSAITGFVSRLIALASAYSKNPTSLARMTIMLLEKLRAFTAAAEPGTAAAAARSADLGMDSSSAHAAYWISVSESSRQGSMSDRGNQATLAMSEEPLFQAYFTTELRLWATSMNVADEVGFPVPYSSHDFVTNFPQYSQNEIFSTAAVLDVVGCQAVVRQVTILTRLRSLFQKCPSDQMLAIIRSSHMLKWGSSISEPALLDMSLLQTLLVNGYSGLFDSTKTDDLLSILLRQKSITKADVEKRVIQLTCHLHKHAQSTKITQVMTQQAANVVQMMGP